MFATGEDGESQSFVSRLKNKMVKSFEDTKKAATDKAEDQNEKRMMDLLESTPLGKFNFTTLRDFYVKMKEEHEAAADNFIASRMDEYRQGLDQIKRFIKILDGFSIHEQQHPILIDSKSIERVSKATSIDTNEIDLLVNGSRSIIAMHRFMMLRKARGLPVPSKPRLIQELMLKEQTVKRQRLQGGYLAYIYQERDAPRKKRLRN